MAQQDGRTDLVGVEGFASGRLLDAAHGFAGLDIPADFQSVEFRLPCPAGEVHWQATGPKLRCLWWAQTHRYQLTSQAPTGTFPGGREWQADSTRFPMSKTITGFVLEIDCTRKPGLVTVCVVPPEVTVHTSSPAVDLLYALYFYLT